jgi:hypothetical protein
MTPSHFELPISSLELSISSLELPISYDVTFGRLIETACECSVNADGLLIACRYDVTFERLIETACEYWHISPLRHVVTDQNGVHFLRRTLVFEALDLSAQRTITKLFLIALHQERSASQKGAVGAVAAAEEDAQDDARDARNLGLEVDKMLKVCMLIASDDH